MTEQNVSRKRSRWPRRIIVLIVLTLVMGYCGRWAYRRCTLTPTPRPEYWLAQYAALDPPSADALPPSVYEPILRLNPLRPDGVLYGYEHFIYTRQWDMLTSIDLSAMDADYAKLHEALKQGWDIESDPYAAADSDCRDWAAALIVYGRYTLATQNDIEKVVDIWLDALRLAGLTNQLDPLAARSHEHELQHIVFTEMLKHAKALRERNDADTLADTITAACGPPAALSELNPAIRITLMMELEECYVRDGGWFDLAGFVERNTGKANVPRAWNLLTFLYDDYDTFASKIDDHLSKCNPQLARYSRNYAPLASLSSGDFEIIGFYWSSVCWDKCLQANYARANLIKKLRVGKDQ